MVEEGEVKLEEPLEAADIYSTASPSPWSSSELDAQFLAVLQILEPQTGFPQALLAAAKGSWKRRQDALAVLESCCRRPPLLLVRRAFQCSSKRMNWCRGEGCKGGAYQGAEADPSLL